MQAPGGPDEDPTGGFALGGWLAQYFADQTRRAAPLGETHRLATVDDLAEEKRPPRSGPDRSR